MKQEKNKDLDNNIKLEEISNILFKSTTKMQIIFYLFTFHEISLSQMAKLLEKPKTTLLHHLNQLENESYIQSREQKTKNYREKLYKIHPHLLKFLKVENNLIKIKIKTKQDQNLMFFIKSFSIFVSSLLDRFFNHVHSENNIDLINDLFLRVYQVDKKQYKIIIERVTKLFQELKEEKIISNKKPQLKDSYIIFNIFAPFGDLFIPIFKEND